MDGIVLGRLNNQNRPDFSRELMGGSCVLSSRHYSDCKITDSRQNRSAPITSCARARTSASSIPIPLRPFPAAARTRRRELTRAHRGGGAAYGLPAGSLVWLGPAATASPNLKPATATATARRWATRQAPRASGPEFPTSCLAIRRRTTSPN